MSSAVQNEVNSETGRKRAASPVREEVIPAKRPASPVNETVEKIPAVPSPSSSSPVRLSGDFFSQSVLDVALGLLGKRLVARVDGAVRSGLIVETEAYEGSSDPAAHSYRKKTARNASMFGPPGTLYVYSIYGCYFCANLSSSGDGCAVLLRALQPDGGLEAMRTGRVNPKTGKMPQRDTDLCNGPSKICQALGITKAQDGLNTCDPSCAVWLEDVGWNVPRSTVIQCRRIGIEGAGPVAAAKPYRFYVRDNANVSKRDKHAETAQAAQAALRVP